MKFNLEKEEDKKRVISYLNDWEIKGKWECIIQKPKRSSKQNNALHLYFSQLSAFFNEIGFEHEYNGIKKMKLSCKWTTTLVKEIIWKEIQKELYGIESTTKINTEQINVIYDAINKALSLRFGKHLPFPSEFSMYLELEQKGINELI